MSKAFETDGYPLRRGALLGIHSVLKTNTELLLYNPQAPSEAEAQCAELARGGKVYAAGSEDMDTLTFNAPILLRHLTFSEAKKQPISEINLEAALKGLDMSMSQVCLDIPVV